MKNQTYWYGYLDAGKKGSLVARDTQLDTGNPDTLYLFNFAKDEILEYKRSVVETKLRELNEEEKSNQKNIEKAFKKALKKLGPLPEDKEPDSKSVAANSGSNKKNDLLEELVKVEEETEWEDADA